MWQERTQLLIKEEGIQRLSNASVLIAGVGGVGGYAVEMLVRAGIGHITIIDNDDVHDSNINRQIIATQGNIGKSKVDLFEKRLTSINPELDITCHKTFIDEENIPTFFEGQKYDFVIDAIDTIAPKMALIRYCLDNKISIISSMGAGGRIDPSKIQISDINKTHHCALAKTVRTQLSKTHKGKKLKVVFSEEEIDKKSILLINEKNKKSTLGTISYIPAVFGCYIASYVIQKIANL